MGVELPFAMTFHALAYAITRPEGAVLMDDPDAKDRSLSATVQGLVDEVLKDDDKARSIRDLMMQHFRYDWEFLNSKEYGMSGEELLLWRRSLPNQTIDGRYRKSPGEKVISDFLFEHGVEYHYERNVWWGDTNYKPDFTILKPGNNKSGLVIEYFGLNDDAYVEQIERKRKFWKNKESWELIELYPKDLAKGIENLASILAPQIKALGIPVNKLTDEEIWKLIEDDAILQYTSLLKGFITRCRQIGWDSERLGQEISFHSADSKSIEGLFLKQAGYMFGAYETTLKAKRETDFSKLIADAVQQIESGATAFYRRSGNGDLGSLRFVFVDEFQDFSFLFDSMVKAIFNINNQVSLFCVGDNWQAINGFAGSDLNYFYNFLESIPNSRRIYLSTNYRSDANIVHFGNSIMDIMSGFDKDAVASKPRVNLPLIGYLDELVPTATEVERSENDLITPALLRIINSQLVLDRDVVVLARAKNIPYYTDVSESGRKVKNLESFLEHIQSFFPEELSKRISISTAHRYKGRERQAVVILDANEKRYPLIHRDWIFSQIFGISIPTLIDDDRRLFYVAATRAIQQLFMISESRESLTPYVQEFGNGHAVLDWSEYGVPASKVNPLIVQVTGSTFAIKEHLSACGYRFMAAAKVWQKAFLPEAFSVDDLKSQSWAHHQGDGPDIRIQVLITKEPHGEIANFEVIKGVWVTNFNRLELIENESTNHDD
jgi:DNA helicase-4